MCRPAGYICINKIIKEMVKYTGPIEWKEEYNVNNSVIDEHHKKFLEILNQLGEISSGGDCNNKISEVFFSLAHYAEHYLLREEIIFKDYPGFAQHKASHNKFMDVITRLHQDYKSGKDDICIDIYDYLNNWFESHILEYDKEAVDYLNSKGIS